MSFLLFQGSVAVYLLAVAAYLVFFLTQKTPLRRIGRTIFLIAFLAHTATLIARACFPQWRHRLRVDGLCRSRPTTPQSQLSGRERRSNLQGVFSVGNGAEVQGKRILVVDDVFTTGSTVNECARVLRKAGAARIEVFTVARSLGGR